MSYTHPNNRPNKCPCPIREKEDCRNKDDVDPISFEDIEEISLRDLIILPSGHCMKKEHLIMQNRWIDPVANIDLNRDMRNPYYVEWKNKHEPNNIAGNNPNILELERRNNFHRRGRAEAERQLQILRDRGLLDVPRAARRQNNDIEGPTNILCGMLFHILYVALNVVYQQVPGTMNIIRGTRDIAVLTMVVMVRLGEMLYNLGFRGNVNLAFILCFIMFWNNLDVENRRPNNLTEVAEEIFNFLRNQLGGGMGSEKNNKMFSKNSITKLYKTLDSLKNIYELRSLVKKTRNYLEKHESSIRKELKTHKSESIKKFETYVSSFGKLYKKQTQKQKTKRKRRLKRSIRKGRSTIKSI